MATHQGPRWAGDQPPEQADTEAMAAYRRALLADAARPRQPIDPFKAFVFLGLLLAVVVVWGGFGWAVLHGYRAP
jgi:hypothetical protein